MPLNSNNEDLINRANETLEMEMRGTVEDAQKLVTAVAAVVAVAGTQSAFASSPTLFGPRPAASADAGPSTSHYASNNIA